jgi:hypothetical protein
MTLTSINFLIKELKKLHNKFTNSSILYEYCLSSNTHFIEVTPFELYNDVKFMENELEFEDLFYEKYPTEDLVFISEQSLNKINKPIFEIFSQKTGDFRTDFITLPNCSNFINSFEFEYQFIGETNYSLAA